MSYAKTAEPIEMPFGIWTRVGPRKHLLGEGAHGRHLANTIEPSMCGGDAACCQITLEHLLYFSLDHFGLVLFAFVVLGLASSVLSQKFGWAERLRNDLFCGKLDVKP